MFPMTITINNEEELGAVLAAFVGTRMTPAPFGPDHMALLAEQKAKAEAPAGKKSAPAAAPAQSSGATNESKASSAPSDTGGSKPRSVDDAKALTIEVVKSKGRDEAVKLLGKYNVPVAAKLAADQVEAFCKDAEAVLAS